MEERSTALLRALDDIKNTLEHLVKAVTGYQESNASEKKQKTETELNAVVRLPVEVTSYYQSEESERRVKKCKENTRIVLEFATIFAAIVLAILTYLNLKAFQRANDQDRRPWVWLEMPARFQVEPGKPITIPLKVFNYGISPAWVRMRINIEAGDGIIKRLEDHPLDAVPDEKGVRKIVLQGNDGDSGFPVDSPQRIATIPDLNALKAGTIEIVAYGRIDYSDLAHPWGPQHDSRFCFYSLQDGTASTCPSEKDHYTNWMH